VCTMLASLPCQFISRILHSPGPIEDIIPSLYLCLASLYLHCVGKLSGYFHRELSPLPASIGLVRLPPFAIVASYDRDKLEAVEA
jgi:hypothetical protein